MSHSKRPWFQVHLSTAMAMMISAGVFLLINLNSPQSHPGGPSGEFEMYGYPLTFEKYNHYNIDTSEIDFSQWQNDDNELIVAIAINVSCMLFGMALIAFLLERFDSKLLRITRAVVRPFGA